MPQRTIAPALAAALLAFAGGCDSPKEAPPAAPSASASSASVDAAKDLKAAKAKAFKPTAEKAFGTLPDGVGIAVGEKAPDFELSGIDGKKVKLAGLLKEAKVLLVFYRGGW